jgi:cobalt/nickel transport system permease protein
MIEQGFDIGNSVIHRLDPRARIVVAAAFSVVVALSDRFPAVLPALLFALILLFLARLPLKKVLSRLLVVNGLILLLWLFLPFSFQGRGLFTLGPLIFTKEGVVFTALITLKANAIILALLALVATVPVFDMGRAMRRLYVPAKIVHLLLFTYRYIHVIYTEYQRVLKAVKIRGFRPGNDLHTYRTYAYLVGILLVRSYDRAERVRAAMLCRGFTGRFYDLSEFAFRRSDWVLTVLMLAAVTGIELLQWAR